MEQRSGGCRQIASKKKRRAKGQENPLRKATRTKMGGWKGGASPASEKKRSCEEK